MTRPAVAFGLVLTGLLLGACTTGDPDIPYPSSAFEDRSPSPDPTVESTWNVGKAQDRAWSAELAEISTTMKKIKPAVEADHATALRAYGDLIDRTNAVLYDMATTAGIAGMGHIGCEVFPVQLLTLPADYPPERAARNLGIFWAAPIADGGADDGTFADAQFDARVHEECPDVRQDVLDVTGLDSLDDLYDYSVEESPAPEVV
ncbi:hypothetical protein [Kineosporia succinea]|uniref:Uncharacterized protein n=1 Tax=Kineosporia succinea TaxID=84632 RepID=A0ABT9P860_9ACTN|nr:hypothetical protein [Kineosporia succinea]MDP9828876.1 hypothetical protein [Kineosporia succinea]